MAADWPLIDALMGGTRTMRAAGKAYLPQWPAEDEAPYRSRLATATLFPAYARTVSVLTGKPFSKPVAYGEDIPPRIRDWLEDVDLQGRNLHQRRALAIKIRSANHPARRARADAVCQQPA